MSCLGLSDTLAAMQTWADGEQARLRQVHEGFDIWFVPKYPVGYTWHARPKGTPVATINSNSPDELSAAISAAELAREGK
jgi:hypothetical protein